MTTAMIWCNADTFKMKMIADVDFNSDASFYFLLLTMMTMMMMMMMMMMRMIHNRDNPSSNEGEKTAAKVLDDGDYSDYSTIEAMCVSW